MRKRASLAALALPLLAACATSSKVEVGPTFAPARYVPPAPAPVAQAARPRLPRTGEIAPDREGADGSTWFIEDAADSCHATYRVPVAYGTTTAIILPPRERLTGAPVGGNAQHFKVMARYAGPSAAVIVSPVTPGARGELRVFTSRCLRNFKLVPSRAPLATVDMATRAADRLPAPGAPAAPEPEGDFTQLAIRPVDGKPLPAWAPMDAWADSGKLVVAFPSRLPKAPTLLAGRRGEQTVTYTTRATPDATYLIARPRTTEAMLVLGEERVGITVDPAAIEDGSAAEPGKAWQQAGALPEPPGGGSSVLIVPGQGGAAIAASPFGFGEGGPSVPVALPKAPLPPKASPPGASMEWL